jgi:type II secretion system protein I
LEVILALAILAGAIAVLGELSRIGMENARVARDMSYAILLCEGKLDEIAAGVTPAEPEQQVPFEPLTDSADSEWLYSIDVASMSDDGLMEIRVTVTQDMAVQARPVEFSLVRWMVDPTIEPIDLTAVDTSSEGDETGEAL